MLQAEFAIFPFNDFFLWLYTHQWCKWHTFSLVRFICMTLLSFSAMDRLSNRPTMPNEWSFVKLLNINKMCVSVCVYLCACICVRVSVCVYLCVFLCIHVHRYIKVYIYVFTWRLTEPHMILWGLISVLAKVDVHQRTNTNKWNYSLENLKILSIIVYYIF